MNMGPGQAKPCQLRAFLTYYINDLFLNQVGNMPLVEKNPKQVSKGLLSVK